MMDTDRNTGSLWNAFAEVQEYAPLKQDIQVDVAVIGGGITGITTAYLLAANGYKVAVLESLQVGKGTTSHSTGNLYFTVDQGLSHLRAKYDTDTIKMIADSRAAALNQIEKWVDRYSLDCDFKRLPWHLYSALEAYTGKIDEELQVAHEAGIPVTLADSTQFGLNVAKGIKAEGQAQLNPIRYVQGLAREAQSDTCTIYECTRVISIDEKKGGVVLKTTGGEVKADFAVHATHSPKGVKVIHALLGPYREYGIACRADQFSYPEGIFWGYHEEGRKFSTRIYERDGKRFLLVVGESHKVGQAASNRSYIQNLENFAKVHFGLTDPVYRWGGQHYRPADLLPYIGREGRHTRTFIATGFSTDGLVYGTLAGMLISDAVIGIVNEWSKVYDPARFQPFKSAKKFLKENINVAAQYAKKLPGRGEVATLDEIQKEEGKVIEKGGKKIAAYRDKNDNLHLTSAVCTHMKCIVNWNDAEKTWDCPCHGSRFEPDGTVLEGPALEPLSADLVPEGRPVKAEWSGF